MPFAYILTGGLSIVLMLAIFAAGVAVEYFAPAQKNQPFKHTIFNVGYAVLVGWFGVALSPLLGIVSTALVNHLGGGLIELPGTGWPLIASAVIYLLAIDFMEYVFHRAQHAWPFLWAMHSLHHSDPSVNITTSARHYWLEVPIKAIFVYPVLAILFKVPPAVLEIYAVSTIWHYLNHLNVRIPFPLPWMIVNTPQFHRLHHSTLPEHYNKNFAPYFPLWDILFGTAHAPELGEYPVTGLDTGEAPANLAQAAIWPFRHQLKKPEPAAPSINRA